MNLLRGVGRILLGGFFIVNGAKAVKDPSQFAAAAEPLAQRFVPLAQRSLPPEAASYLPEDTETLVRANGALSVIGGLGMATGLGRRGGAGLAALSMIPHVFAANPRGGSAQDRDAQRSLLVRNLALLGAALVVSQDTAGQPSLLWRASDARKRLAKGTERAAKSVSHEAQHTGRMLAKDARHLQRQARLQARVARKSIEGALP